MRLRSRLVLSVVLVAIPVALLTIVAENLRDRRRSIDVLGERTRARLEGLTVDDCEASPEEFPDVAPAEPGDWLFGSEASHSRPEPPGVRYFVLDARGRPYRDDAPRIPPRVLRSFADGRPVSFQRAGGRGRIEYAIVRPEWESSICSAILVARPSPRAAPIAARLVAPFAVTFAVAFAVLLVAGPVVRRIRRLTEAVAHGRVDGIGGEDELGELARAFETRESTIAAQIAELSASETAMREHLAATSHDVLLPITVLQGHLVELERIASADGKVPPALVRGALEETHYVVSLVRDLNADARLRSGIVVTTEVDLGALVERARARHAPIARHAALSLEVAVPESGVEVLGDPTLLEQMISNLVHNAVRYGEPDGHIAVVLESHDGRFELTVADDGPGVPAELLDRLGDRGFRSDEARTRRPEGMGLGLHIVREVCVKHGFSLRFSAGEPRGLVVRVSGPSR